MNGIEYILVAATHFDNNIKYSKQPEGITTGIVLCGHRHDTIIQQIGGLVRERRQLGIHRETQGFLTSHNRFVQRGEAAKIAFVAGQIENYKKELFSEDLY